MRKPYTGDFPITQEFGENPQTYAQFGLKGHNGQDIGLPTGTDIVSAIKGEVVEIAFDPQGYGDYIKVENDQ